MSVTISGSSPASTSTMAPPAWTALPLLVTRTDNASPLYVPDDTRAYLQSLRAPSVHVVGITGPPNTGKRLLLKTMLHADADAVPFRKTLDDEHVLLWLWRPSMQSDDHVRLVISLNLDHNHDHNDGKADSRRATTALLLLLSSVLLYNDDGEIDAQALERLAWLRDVSASLRIKSNQDDDAVAADFHQHAPLFVWVQRNSKIKWLTDSATGDKISASQYLEQCLQEEAGFSDAVAQRNAQRMYLQSLFHQRECVALSRAVEGAAENTEDALALPREALRSQFVEAVDKYLVDAFLSLRTGGRQLLAKKLLSRELCADQFIHVLDAYVSALNANALPAMQVAANALVQKTVEAALAAARVGYEAALNESATLAKPVDLRQISVAHWRGLQRAMVGLQTLQSQLPEHIKKTLLADGLTSLRDEFSQRLKELLETNDASSKALCAKLLTETLPANLEQIASQLEAKPRESFSDGLVGLLTQYKSDLRDAVDKYKAEAVGPALHEALVEALQAAVFESIKIYGASVLRQYQQHMRSLHEQRTEVEHELELAKTQDTNAMFSTDDHKRLYEEQLEQSTQLLTELRRVLLGELNAKKSELGRLVSDLSTMDVKHEVRVKSMESDLAWVRSRTEELEKTALAERQRLEQDATGATDEMIVKERTFHQEERSLLAQQKDLLARVVELERELVQKKTKHVQQTFVIESELAKRMDELKQEQAEFARQLKSQAKTDTGVLKLAYQKKKTVVQAEIDRVARDIQEYEAKLQLFETIKSPRTTTSASTSGSAGSAEPAASTTVVSTLRTSSREFLFKSPDVLSPRGATTRVNRSDTDMCKTQ